MWQSVQKYCGLRYLPFFKKGNQKIRDTRQAEESPPLTKPNCPPRVRLWCVLRQSYSKINGGVTAVVISAEELKSPAPNTPSARSTFFLVYFLAALSATLSNCSTKASIIVGTAVMCGGEVLYLIFYVSFKAFPLSNRDRSLL